MDLIIIAELKILIRRFSPQCTGLPGLLLLMREKNRFLFNYSCRGAEGKTNKQKTSLETSWTIKMRHGMGWIEQFGVVNVSVNLNRSHANMARFQSRWFFFRLLINKKSLSRLWLSLLLRELSPSAVVGEQNFIYKL
jgi:hypothetical protein